MNTPQIQLLDATLRDGGQGLEDNFRNAVSERAFGAEGIAEIVRLQTETDIDIIELGAMGPSEDDRSRFSIYQGVEELSRIQPRERNRKQLYVGLYIGPDTPVADIPDWNPDLVDGVRVILRYSELKKSIGYCAALAAKGYKMFVQPMLTMRYTKQELDYVIDASNEMGAYALYFVDSYGYMDTGDVKRLFGYYDARLDDGIRIGFHAHNNMNSAYANACCFADIETGRARIVDACATGMGQGAGNLQTELFVPFLNGRFGKSYRLDPVLDICDLLEKLFPEQPLWGYSPARMLPALYKTAYKYAFVMRHRYHLRYRDIRRLLEGMPDELRHRYTAENLDKVLSLLA